MDYPRVSIIILNWNGWKDTIECLESLYRITYPNYDVIVVDNGSQDDSIQRIKEYAEGKIRVDSKFFEYNPANKPIRVFEIEEDDARRGRFKRPLYEKFDVDRRMILIKNKDNYGFAGGNNVGIKFALIVLNPEYVLLLNNDTVVDPKFLDELVKVAESDEKIGVVGSRINSYFAPNIIQFAGTKKFFAWKGGFRPYLKNSSEDKLVLFNRVVDTPVVEGSSMLVRKSIFSRVGLIPEEYFLYNEETDFCLSVLRSGFPIKVAINSVIWHKESVSVGGNTSPLKIYYGSRNKLLLVRKYGNIVDYFLLFILNIPYSIIYYLIKLKNPLKLLPLLRGLIDGIEHKTGKTFMKH